MINRFGNLRHTEKAVHNGQPFVFIWNGVLFQHVQLFSNFGKSSNGFVEMRPIVSC
jgi:hypothetical protein